MASNRLKGLSIDLGSMISDIAQERRIMPLLTAAEKNGFKDFSVEVQGYHGGRGNDGWWHPSAHSTWGARQLFYYLTRPDQIVEEEFDVNAIEAVTSGTFWHGYLQNLLGGEYSNILVADEVPVISSRYRVRGHIDGELAEDDYWGKELLEIKTINRYSFKKVNNEDELKQYNPQYWGQAQTYLALRFGIGIGRMRFLTIDPSFPFPKTEFTVPANPGWQRRRLDIYEQTWQLVQAYQAGQNVEPPSACCEFGSVQAANCAARFVCPIGRP